MPTRLIREGILKSPRVNELDPPAEVFYRRLMSIVDDHGLFEAHTAILRADLFPLRVDKVREADISRWIAACEKAGLIALYEAGGKNLGQMLDTKWQVRSEPKWPLPPDRPGGKQPSVNGGEQVKTAVHLDVVEVVSEDDKHHGPRAEGRFAEFWKTWPATDRKVNRKGCAEKWRAKKLEANADAIIAHVEAMKRTRKWLEGFEPRPDTYLAQELWQDGVPDERKKADLNDRGEIRQWHEYASGITAKGSELGVVQKQGEAFPHFRARVYAAAGHSPARGW